MKKKSVLFMITLVVMTFILSAYNAGIAADYKVALLVSKKSHATVDLDKMNINRGYAVEGDRNAVIDEQSAEDYINSGLVHDEAGRYDKAIEAYRKAIIARPESAEAHYYLAMSYMMSHDSIAAHDEYKVLKKLNPPMADSFYEKAFTLVSADTDSKYVMQVGAFRNIENANVLVEKLKEEYLNAYIEHGKKFNRVKIVGIKSLEEAELFMKDLNHKFSVDPFVLLKDSSK
ncbi:MAG: SPOR domain-containing protein [Nitrospirota bacterium]